MGYLLLHILLLTPLPPLLAPSPLHALSPRGGPHLFGGGVLLFCCPVPLPSPPPLPPPLQSLPLRPLPPRVGRVCCLCGARSWPLGGLRPGSVLTILLNNTRACSLGVPLPPKGGGTLSPTPANSLPSPPDPSAPLCLEVWVLCRSWSLPPLSCIRPCTKGMRSCLGGPPPLLLGGVSPPTCRALGTHAAWGVAPPLGVLVSGPPPFPCLHAVH